MPLHHRGAMPLRHRGARARRSPHSTRFKANHTARDIVAGSCLRFQEPLSRAELTGIGSPYGPNEQGAGCKVHKLGESRRMSAIAMSLPCHCHVIAMSLPCHCHVIAAAVYTHIYAGNDIYCHVVASSLPDHGCRGVLGFAFTIGRC